MGLSMGNNNAKEKVATNLGEKRNVAVGSRALTIGLRRTGCVDILKSQINGMSPGAAMLTIFATKERWVVCSCMECALP